MKKELYSASDSLVSGHPTFLGVSPFERLKQGSKIDSAKLTEIIKDSQDKLNAGLSSDVIESCFNVLENYSNPIDIQARLNYMISVALEMEGRFQESLEILAPFEDREVIKEISLENLASVYAQRASGYAYLNELDKAIDSLNIAHKIVEERELSYQLINVKLIFARIYREKNDYPVSRNFAERALKVARDSGDRNGLAEAYRVIATTYHQEGDSQKAIELLQQSLQILGDRPATQFLLGKIYSDMSVAYSALSRSQDGIDVLKRSISLFEKIKQKFWLAIAYNNLGINLLINGNWKKADEILNKAVDLAIEVDHTHLAIIVCSVGELNLLRGDLEEAEKLFGQALSLAEEKKKTWQIIHISYNLARCLLEQKKTSEALKKCKEIIALCEQITEKHFRLQTSVVLGECYLKQNKIPNLEETLAEIEANDISHNLFIQGNVARLHGFLELEKGEESLASNHFNRALSIFTMAGDFYYVAIANFELGKAELKSQPEKALKHLNASLDAFRQLEIPHKVETVESILSELKNKKIEKTPEKPTNAHLLMLRLLESISSRELLFRELMAILQQEGKSKKIIIAESKDGGKLSSSFIDGFNPSESLNLLNKLHDAHIRNNLDNFIKDKNLAVFNLRAPNSLSATLIISPASKAVLADGSSIQPLLRVVELGMEVCSFRENIENSPNPNISDSSPLTSQNLMPDFIHSSPAMMELVSEIQKIRSSDVTTLITGESGTGKELIAKAIHIVSKRKDKVFIPFNCTAVPKELTEGHLFGYKKGAFTGAVTDSVGVIRAADGGTLFLDEIGDLPLDVQPKILRFLQEGEVQPLGEKSPKKVDVRIVAATNMNLEEKVAQGLFREDLYYRLNVIRLKIPPLRERRSEIPQLVNHYINVYSEKFGRNKLTMSSEAMDLLIAYNWQGNVRQLCNEVQRIVARSDNGDKISPLHLSDEIKPSGISSDSSITRSVQTIGLGNSINVQVQGTLDEIVSALEIQLITDSLKRNDFVVARVARELGLTRRGLYLKLERYKIKYN